MAVKNNYLVKDLNNFVTSILVKLSVKKGKVNDDDVFDLVKIFEFIIQMNKKFDKLEYIEQYLIFVDEDIRDFKQFYIFVYNIIDELVKQ